MKKVILVLLTLAIFLCAAPANAQVNWIDPLQYQKPKFVPIVMPDEATVQYKYYVDMSSGSGSSCTQSAPCREMDNLLGKPGTTGGPAYVYVKGTGNLSFYNDNFYGSPGKEIVIKPWPGSTATFTGNSNTNSTNVHDLIFDGGPDLGITFLSNTTSFSIHIISNNTTIYRTRNTSSTGANLLLSVGDSRSVSGVRIINNEFYGCNTKGGYQCSAVYVGPGGGGGYSNLLIQNNIVRDMGGEGIEVNPRVTSSNATIIGNAIHNVGKQTCSGSWQCRPGITMSIQSGGGNNNTLIANNLIWDVGSSCVWDRGGGSPRAVIANNTCYDYGKGSGGGGPNPEGISGYTDGGSATIRNNIIYAPNGMDPFDKSNFTASNNICGSSESCGSAKQNWSNNTVVTVDQNVATFLTIGSSSEARNNGVTVANVTKDYADLPRPKETAFDIGAFEFSGAIDPDQDCVFTWPETWETVSIESCVGGQQWVNQRQSPIITTPSTGNGKRCPDPRTQRIQQSCTLPVALPPSLTQVCTIVLKDSAIPPDATGGWTVVYRRNGSIVTFPDVVQEGSHTYTAEWTKAGIGIVISPAIDRVCKGS